MYVFNGDELFTAEGREMAQGGVMIDRATMTPVAVAGFAWDGEVSPLLPGETPRATAERLNMVVWGRRPGDWDRLAAGVEVAWARAVAALVVVSLVDAE